jgi:murein DD-endopeptidase MepM/ murein hydrolase activator NlpD
MTRRTARKKKALPDLGPAPRSRNGLWVAILLAALVLVNLYVFVWNKETSLAAVRDKAKSGPAMVVPGGGALAGDDRGAGPRGVLSGLLARAMTPPAPLGDGVLEGTVTGGDSLGRLLKRSGLTAQQTDEVIRALHGVLDFKSIRAGQRFRLARDGRGEVQSFELILSKISTVRAARDAAGQLQGSADRSQTRVEVKQLGGRIDSSLYAAIKAAGEDSSLVAFFVDVFAYDLDFYNDTHDGDVFRVVVEKEYKDDEFLGYRRILAAEYTGKVGTFRTYHFAPEGDSRGRYFDAAGESAEKTFLKTPLKFARVSSGFDRRRMHPVLHTVRAHLGIDYAAPVGTPIWAAAPGKIISRGPAGGAGNMIVLRHDNGLDTVYMHLSKFAAGQKVGQFVEAKTVIGFVGTTGLSTGPHLHFGVKRGGAFVDPTKLAPLRRGSVAKQHRDAFQRERQRLQALLDAAHVATEATPVAGGAAPAASRAAPAASITPPAAAGLLGQAPQRRAL